MTRNTCFFFLTSTLFLFLIASCPAVELDLGRRAELDDPSVWSEWPSSLSNQSNNAAVSISDPGLAFSVPEADRGMIWRRALRPVWLEYHHYLTYEYQVTDINKSSVYPVMRFRTFGDSWFTAVLNTVINDDGLSHSHTIDIGTLTTAAQIIGVEIRLQSASGGGAGFILKKLEFTDHLPGYLYPPPTATTPVNTGFELDTSTAASWSAKPEWLSVSNVASIYSVDSTGSSLIISVTDSGKGMKWHNNSIGTQDSGAFSYVFMRYRCENINPAGTNYALWLANSVDQDRPFYQGDLIDDGLWHWAFAPITISEVTQMALQVQSSTAGNAYFEIESLDFVDGDPRNTIAYYSSLKEGWSHLSAGTDGYQMIDLSGRFNADAGQLLPRMGINADWFADTEIAAEPWIPFGINTGSTNLIATDHHATSVLEIALNATASEAYFLLGACLTGRENMFLENIIQKVDETERFYIDIVYDDKSEERYFPVETFSGLHEIRNNTFSAYAVPCDPLKTIARIRLYDGTDGGMFALGALTLKTSAGAHYSGSFSIQAADPKITASQPSARTASVSYVSGILSLESTYYRYEFNLNDGILLNNLISYYSDYNIMATSSDHRFFSGTIDSVSFTSQDFSILDVTLNTALPNPGATVTMELVGYEGIIQAVLEMEIGDNGQALFSMSLNNLSVSDSYAFELLLPDIQGMTLDSAAGNISYIYPARTLVMGDYDIDIEDYYSGEFPVQFLDVYNPGEGWGLYLLVRDLALIHKYYHLYKTGDSASWSVRYPTLTGKGLPAGESLEIAPFSLGIHNGDWHEAMDAYKQWTDEWYTPQSPRQDWFQEIYSCRRDYPIGGTEHLLDRVLNQYTFDREIANADRYLGGADLIDISSWGWSATYGRVGDYRRYELGGLANFHDGIAFSQSQGVPVGLYIEGYLLDERSTAYGEHGDEWKMLNSSGEEIRSGAHEVVMCPYAETWQDYMVDLYSAVVAETNADAMYIDVFGYGMIGRSCYSDQHGHDVGVPPLRGEYQMTRKIREGLNAVRAGIPLYTEYSPVDFISQYQDGSFSYTISSADYDTSPTATSLFRYCFPDFKRIELVNGLFMARNWTEEGLKKAFFNGEGIWIKGNINAWYDADTVAFYIKSHEIFRDHRDAFTSDNPDPLLPCLVGNVYSNNFTDGDKQVFTFYNGNWCNIDTDLISAGELTDKHIVDIWGECEIGTAPGTVSDYIVAANLNPRDIGCVGIFNRYIEATFESNMLEITLIDNPPGDNIEIVGVLGKDRTYANVSKESQTIDLNTVFSVPQGKLIVKLKLDGIVQDMYIVENQEVLSEVNPDIWERLR